MKDVKDIVRVLHLFAKYDSYEYLFWFTKGDEVTFNVNVNDTFGPCADAEEVTVEGLDSLEAAFKEAQALEDQTFKENVNNSVFACDGIVLWVARTRRDKPWSRHKIHPLLQPLYDAIEVK